MEPDISRLFRSDSHHEVSSGVGNTNDSIVVVGLRSKMIFYL